MTCASSTGEHVRWREMGSPTARAIHREALALFYARGYEATTLREIADAVGITVGSLYNHISSKQELLVNLMTSMMDLLNGEIDEALDGLSDPLDRLHAFMHRSILVHGHHREETFVGNNELRSLDDDNRLALIAMRDNYEKKLRSILETAVNAGCATLPDIQMATFAGLAICAHVATWYEPGGRLALDEIADSLCATYAPLAQAGTHRRSPPRRSDHPKHLGKPVRPPC